MLIAIPSAGRATEQQQRTLNALKTAGHNPTLFVPRHEALAYVDIHLNTIILDEIGIGPTRQAILDFSLTINSESVLMLDDDLEFFVRRKDDPTKLQKATPAQLRAMVKRAGSLLNKYAHIGVATREGANRSINPLHFNVRLLRALGYRADVLKRERVTFDRLPVMEDFDVALQLLRLGYPSAQINDYLQDQPGSNVEGGCSTYRSANMQARAARGLAKLHPNFVTVVEKPVPKSGGWFDVPRLDVRVAWKKAFESSGEIKHV
jgi:hypothetical protein